MSQFDETTVITEEPAGRSPAVLALAVLGALLVGALLWFFVAAPLLGGGADDETVVPSASETLEAESTEGAEEAAVGDTLEAADETALPIVTYEVFLDRDPFDPVVPEPLAATEPVATDGTTDGATDGSTDGATDGGTTDGSTDGGATDGGPTDGGTTDGGATDGGTSGGCTTGENVVCDGRVVSLVDIRTADDGERTAIVQVDTTLYEARAGETFAGSFRVQSISGDRVFLLYGDDAFELTVGDRVLK